VREVVVVGELDDAPDRVNGREVIEVEAVFGCRISPYTCSNTAR
jgi:hypothetical protein